MNDNKIKEILKKHNTNFVAINNESSLIKIEQLLSGHSFVAYPETEIEYLYFGWYYATIQIDYTKMKMFFMKAINYGNATAMNNMAMYYMTVKRNYEKMKKYFVMAIDHGSVDAMHNFGSYFEDINNYQEMTKYFMMAIACNNSNSMTRMGRRFYKLKQYDMMKKYYLMAIEYNNADAMNSMGFYYENIEKNYSEMVKYYLMAIKHDPDSIATYNLAYYYKDNKDYTKMKQYLLMGIKRGCEKSKNVIIKYYKKEGCNDYSVVDLFEFQHEIDIYELMVSIFKRSNVKLPAEFHSAFCKWNFSLNQDLDMKQYILKKTGIFPSNYNAKYLTQFMELLSFSRVENLLLTKDVILTIAGYIFI